MHGIDRPPVPRVHDKSPTVVSRLRFSIRFLLLLLVLLASVVAPYRVSGLARPAQDSLKIAILAPFTGPAAFIGQEQLNFARLALADFTASRALPPIEVVAIDTALDPVKALRGAESIATDPAVMAAVG